MNMLEVASNSGRRYEAANHREARVEHRKTESDERIATATAVEAFCAPSTESAASVNPINSEPESPRKMEAGLKL